MPKKPLRQSPLHRRACTADRSWYRRFAGNTHYQLHSCAAIGNFLLNASGSHTLERGQKRSGESSAARKIQCVGNQTSVRT